MLFVLFLDGGDITSLLKSLNHGLEAITFIIYSIILIKKCIKIIFLTEACRSLNIPIQLMSIHVLTRIGQDHIVKNRHLGQGYIVKHRRT